MLLEVTNLTKSVGAQVLFSDVSFSINQGEKLALIGRNGHGKTTLLKILSGDDHDFGGEVEMRKGTRVTLTQQEHLQVLEKTPLKYVLDDVPNYYEYKQILEEYENGQHTRLNQYLETLEYFTRYKYFHVEEAIISTLEDFGISPQAAQQPLGTLSGGQKRYVEMTRMMFSRSDLYLIDEPTNHLDYQGKERFIKWMNSNPGTMLIVTHDRDVLQNVTKILELKDKKISFYKGNYDQYITQNTNSTLSSVKHYTDQLARLKEAKKKADWGLQMRAKSKAWKTRYDQWQRQYESIQAQTVKPSFWIDQESVEQLDEKISGSYHKFKEKNIRINATGTSEGGAKLVSINRLALGYDEPLFNDLTFSLRDTEKVFIKGRNGAGKSTLVKTIIQLAHDQKMTAVHLEGEIKLNQHLKIGEYQQEIANKYVSMPLEEAVFASFEDKGEQVETSHVRSLLAQYLFNPSVDGKQKIMQLSGGQKARFQLMTMFIGNPNLLILDEPTNHLDLPSIEELENSLSKFKGGIIYISHDTYFINRMGGTVVELG